MTLEAKRKAGGVWEEFGLVSSFEFKAAGIPFLVVEKFNIDHRQLYHRTRWRTEFSTPVGISYLLWAHSQFIKEYVEPKEAYPATKLQIEASVPPEPTFDILQQPLSGFDLNEFSMRLTGEFGGTSFKYGRKEAVETNYPFGNNPYIEISSSLNLADFITGLLPVSCAVSSLPLETTRRRLKSIYRNYPKPW